VETWLTGHGFNVTKVNAGKQTLEFTGNAAQVRSAFHTQIHQYGQWRDALRECQRPADSCGAGASGGGFVSLNNFRVKSNAKVLGKATYDPKTDKATPEWTWARAPASTSCWRLRIRRAV